jgi:hypothetical protein
MVADIVGFVATHVLLRLPLHRHEYTFNLKCKNIYLFSF